MAANKPPPQAVKKLDQDTFMNAAAQAGLQFTVFVAGPYIETEKKPRPGAKNKAKRLRHSLCQRLMQFGWTVTLGEYQKLIDAANPLFGNRNDAANAELLHAKQSAHAVVMLPSSPGSFMELGAFSFHKDVCEKMIIIVDSVHKNDEKNYFNTGTIPGAKNRGAIVEYLDYDDHDRCWDVVWKFLKNQGSIVAEKRFLAP